MPFDSSSFDGTILMLLALTVGMMVVRFKAKLENNWPVFYWMLLVYIAYSRHDTWNFNVVSAGAISALLLRFEVMAPGLITLVQMVEFTIWGYILYHGCRIVFY